MRLVVFELNKKKQLGVKMNQGILPVDSILDLDSEEILKNNKFISDKNVLENIKKEMNKQEKKLKEHLINENDINYLPCVPEPGKVICVGKNYAEHAQETNDEIPDSPILFSKFSDSVTGHMTEIPIPYNSNELDYEAELMVVIGEKASKVSESDALNYVFGYCNSNDLSARDLQFKTNQWLLGKTGEKLAPMGPYLLTSDEVDNIQDLGIRCYVNDKIKQSSNTKHMIFTCSYLIHYISHYMTLNPGDVIMTGTPEGVILGYPESERKWLKSGDKVKVEIDGLGELVNKIV